MILRRDPIGESTCYWTRDEDGTIRQAARLRPLLPSNPEIDVAALRDYLSCAFIPGDRTMVSGIRELRPGTVWDTGLSPFPSENESLREGTWDPEAPIEEHARRLRPLLDAAVASRLPSDPREAVGVFLSGGLDSSLVTALVKRLHPGPVHTFSLHFGDSTPNELAWSQMVADHCATNHHVLEFPAAVIRENLVESIQVLDDPIGDPLTTPNLLLARAARDAGIKRVFNGEGGDPVFGGPKNLPMVLHALYSGNRDDARSAYFRSYQKCYDDLPSLWTPEAVRGIAQLSPQEALLDPYLEDTDNPMESYLNRLMRINVRLKGADHILTKVACMAGHYGLTACSPLFDTDVVEAGFGVPPRTKLDGSREKAVLKEAVRDLLPVEILERPKSGMMVPVQKWFRGPMRSLATDLLLSRDARIKRWIESAPIQDWLAYKPMTPPRQGVKLWLLLTLEIWLREAGVTAPQRQRRWLF